MNSLDVGPKELNRLLKFKKLFNHIISENRFALTIEMRDDINQIIDLIKTNCAITLEKGCELYRARIHESAFEICDCYSYDDMLGPPAKSAPDGRLNPKGIPYLYTSFKEETCIYECRPWIGSELTVVRLKLNKDVNVIDVNKAFKDQNENADLFFVWITEIRRLFSEPVHQGNQLTYLPTQYISEIIKSLNFDGIKFKSSIDENGYNLALFSKNDVNIEYMHKIKVNGIRYEFDEAIYKPDSVC